MRFYSYFVAAAAGLALSICSQGNGSAQTSKAPKFAESSAASHISAKTVKKSKSEEKPLIEEFLIRGRTQEGKQAVIEAMSLRPNDDQLRFSLAIVQILQTLERFSQDICYFGFKRTADNTFHTPFIDIDIPCNPEAHPISHEKFQQVINRALGGLEEADQTLSEIKDPAVELRLPIGLMRVDLNGDGLSGDKEMLWRIYQEIHHNPGILKSNANSFVVNLDRGDVHWLRGYLNIITSVLDMYLAYDSQETFNFVAPVIFERVDGPPPYIESFKSVYPIDDGVLTVVDLVAAAHSLRWNVSDRKRLEKALFKLETVISESRVSWKFILAETDNDCEWLPNPRQKGIIPGMYVNDEMVEAWAGLMDELELILEGELLVPFWRGEKTQYGINVRKLFLEPITFDPIYWAQGTAMRPYLEKGRLAKSDVWKRIERVFGDEYMSFAAWFN